MSFALTTDQVRARQKTVTRRIGWKNAEPGDVVQPVVKGQGIPKGGKVERIGGPIIFTSVRREALRELRNEHYGGVEARLEGFPQLAGWQFVEMFRDHNGGDEDQEVTRIEFDYLRRFWLSWVQQTDDYRPLTFPPTEAVLGWWCSGYDPNDHATLCALVEAVSLDAAKLAVRVSWPEAPSHRQAWRIENEVEPTWLPNDRFPLSPWMKKRIA